MTALRLTASKPNFAASTTTRRMRHPASMAALTSLVPMSQITYGSDYPYYPLNQIENLRHRLSPQDVAAISSGNAMRLLPRLSA